MGCSGYPRENKNEEYFKAYISLKSMTLKIKDHNILDEEAFLITTKSIPIFIGLINKSNALKHLTDSPKYDKRLLEYFKTYKLEKKINIICNYKDCSDLIQKEEENEFIIVDYNFFKAMEIDKEYKSSVYIQINKDKKNDEMKIFFPTSHKLLYFEEKSIGFYKFKNIDYNSNQEFISNSRNSLISLEKNEKNLEKSNEYNNNNEKESNIINSFVKRNNENFDYNNIGNSNNITKNQNINNKNLNYNNNYPNKYMNNNNKSDSICPGSFNLKSNFNMEKNIQNNNSNMNIINCNFQKNNNQIMNNNFQKNNTSDIVLLLPYLNNNQIGNNHNNINCSSPIINNNIINDKVNMNIKTNKNEAIDNKNFNDNNKKVIEKIMNEYKNNNEKRQKIPNLILLFKSPTLIGLQNIGATCYMNAPLQCLSNIGPLTNYFLLNKEKFLKIEKYNKDYIISKAYSDVIYNLWDESKPNTYYSPYYFKEIISKENKLFEGIQANDSKDLVLFLYQRMHKELNEKNENTIVEEIKSDQKDPIKELFNCLNSFRCKNKSIISDLFYFSQANVTKCLHCGVCIYNFSMYNILIFPLEKTRLFKAEKSNSFAYVNIFDCFECHTADEKNQPGNKMHCNSCKNQSDYIISNKIGTLPDILTIILNRGNNLKFDVEFQIYYILDNLDNYMINLKDCENEKIEYELIAIIIHTGNSGMDGHFYTYCRSPVNRKWYSYNDSMVKELNDPIEEIRGIPYLLFYQRIKVQKEK